MEGAKAAAFKVGNKIPFVLEVCEPVAKHTQLADWTAKYREGIYSVTFKARLLARAADYLKAKGLRLVGDLSSGSRSIPQGCTAECSPLSTKGAADRNRMRSFA